MPTSFSLELFIAVLIVLAISGLVVPIAPYWLQAKTAGSPIGFFTLVGLRLRKVDPRVLVYSHIRAVRAGLSVTVNQLETHHHAGGRLAPVISALIAAKGAGVRLTWAQATALDLAGEDVPDLVAQSAKSKNLNQPAAEVDSNSAQ